MEQGTHRELLAMDGVFASMWADQVSAEDRAPSITDRSIKKEVTGYSVEGTESHQVEAEPTQDTTIEDVAPTSHAPAATYAEAVVGHEAAPAEANLPEETLASPYEEVPSPSEEPAPAEPSHEAPRPTSYAAAAAAAPSADAPVVELAQAPGPPAEAPIAFPSSDDTASQQTPSVVESTQAQTHAVTFGAGVDSPPSQSRSGTPDPGAEPKRKRISSQNFQRLARRMSFGTKRQGSASSVTASAKPDTSPRDSRDEGSSRGEGSIRGEGESPAASIQGTEGAKGKKEKDKKKKKKGSN